MFTVLVSRSSFNEVLRDLRGAGSIAIPVDIVPGFIDSCEMFDGVSPVCGPIVRTEDGQVLQYLYL